MPTNTVSEKELLKFVVNHPYTCKHVNCAEIKRNLSIKIKNKFEGISNSHTDSCLFCAKSYIINNLTEKYVDNLFNETQELHRELLTDIRSELIDFYI